MIPIIFALVSKQTWLQHDCLLNLCLIERHSRQGKIDYALLLTHNPSTYKHQSKVTLPKDCMAVNEIGIKTIGDLSREVRVLNKTNLKWLFRGHADATWNVIPSVFRGYSQQQERYLTNEFRVRARSRHYSSPQNSDYPGWLALMQHYGLPTRLLDWTHSPLVAAFFAAHPDYAPTGSTGDRDVCIWALAAGPLNESQGFEPLIFPLDAVSYEPLIVPAFKNRLEPDTVGVTMAIEHDTRIQVQQSAFTIHSIRTPLNLLEGCDNWLCKFVINSENVKSFFEELDLLGIRKSNLFPDLPSLASELKFIHRPS